MSVAIVWFRHDLRLADNPALASACAEYTKVIPLYVYDSNSTSSWAHGGASRWWLDHSLRRFSASLAKLGTKLVIANGKPYDVITQLVKKHKIGAVHWNRVYEPDAVDRERKIRKALREPDVEVNSFNAALINEPWAIENLSNKPYRVFTPYWKKCLVNGIDVPLISAPSSIPAIPKGVKGVSIKSLELIDPIPWHADFGRYWTPGEEGAYAALDEFLDGVVDDYDLGRDLPAKAGTSRISPHLHFGEISPRQVVSAVRREARSENDAARFLSEIGWREFAHHLLYHFPHTVDSPLNEKFAKFPWRRSYKKDLRCWQQGQTGIPLVDAGMRELWQTGWMHNRVRMIVASFLIKNLRIHWIEGAKWFWDTLVDADLASNSMGWQWCAGSGADASPYFRIFNPVTQGERFDKQGVYVRKWVPEIAALPDKYLHKPAMAPASVLLEAGIELGKDYPSPIVDLKTSREVALNAYKRIK